MYEANTGTLLQRLELILLGRYEWAADNKLVIWELSRDGRQPYRLRDSPDSEYPCLWLLILHPTGGIVSMTSSTNPFSPMDASLSPGQPPALMSMSPMNSCNPFR